MDKALFGIPNLDVYLVLGILIAFGVMEVIAGHFNRQKRSGGDWVQEFGGFIVLSIVIKPAIVLSVLTLGATVFSSAAGVVSNWSMWIAVPIYLLVDDVLQYWYHRSAHEYEFLWKLHRPHHQAEEMGFFVSYRNAALYYVIMPNLWWTGIFTFLGGGLAVALGLVLKQLVIIGSHSTLPWDNFFYKNKFLTPFMSVLERIIITPAFHHGHHGKSMLDGIGDPNGNFGNMFSIWDQVFGTAKFTRQFPESYGLMHDPKEHWSAAYLWPAVKSDDPESELSKSYTKKNTSTLAPVEIHLEACRHLWCACGKSKDQPFCDGKHHGSKYKPILFEVKRSGQVKLCNCKLSKAGPFCDNAHVHVERDSLVS
ncbi:MAG: sterol desaturase family protein [Bacteroidota bacterium]